jgi:small subunit ribosomal protein S4
VCTAGGVATQRVPGQLLEKQRLRGQYNLRERQFRRIVGEAMRRPGKTGETLIELLERRLDAVVLRSGFARTIYQARQMVTPPCLGVDLPELRAALLSNPRRREVPVVCDEQRVVEFYSR